ncbi:MAG TPA: efflux RND transporter periplasmic adaptor subunit [Sedimentisphaerales bacterium]|nr:efflux RND transporter periplasmic adaptor subunit [Sedimentisphaerales bacterium]
MKLLVKLTVITIGALFMVWIIWLLSHPANGKTVYITAPVKISDLLITISATGTVEPEEIVDVGAQVAGKIDYFGKDKNDKTIDYGSDVEQDTVLAKIDDSLYVADVSLASAQLQEANAKLYQAEKDWTRAQKLGPSEALAESSYDAYKSAYEIAKANVAFTEATLARAKRNLDYCTIKSPVKGVIIDRRVNIGQTVVASLNAPSLFLIAKDLKRMQVWVSVNETDIGNIYPEQAVKFTVDAFPNEIFQGTVGKIRYNATMTQNVVTYTVEVITDNISGKLFPYLTANVQFIVKNYTNVLLVPNMALRWSPDEKEIVAEFRKTSANKPQTETQDPSIGTVWVQHGAYVKPINVKLGPSDGTKTEIQSNEIKEGMLVITGRQQTNTDTGTTNPFVPQIRKGKNTNGAK